MARIGLGVAGLAFLVAAATATVCTAQTTTPVVQPLAMPTCAPVPISLSPCIGYVFGLGSASLPSCCSQLQAFFKSQGPCLCAMSKLAPNPFGLVLGQVQGMIPNVCNLPTDPCDDLFGASASTSPDDSTNATATSATAPATAPVAEPATKTSTDADAAPGDDSPAVATAPGQVAPQGAGSKDSQGTSKFPELLHAAGARSSAAGTVLISVLLAYVSAMFV